MRFAIAPPEVPRLPPSDSPVHVHASGRSRREACNSERQPQL